MADRTWCQVQFGSRGAYMTQPGNGLESTQKREDTVRLQHSSAFRCLILLNKIYII
jgi:hypothetical protein